MTFLLLLLVQAASPAQLLEEAVDAFAGGKDEARAAILKQEARAVMALRKAREKAPARIDPLLYEIKKRAGGDEHAAVVKSLEEKYPLEAENWEFGDTCVSLGLPVLLDPALLARDPLPRVTLAMNRPRHEILDALCRRANLDWGLFYGVVLIAAPGRLWPPGPLPEAAPLTEEQARRAAGWIARLGSDRPEEREEVAGELLKLGEGAIPLLEKSARGQEAEVTARLRDLVARLRQPPPAGAFHSPAAARQPLAGGDAALAQELREGQISFKVSDILMHGCLRLMLGPRNLRGEYGPSLQEKRVSLDLQNQSLWAVLSVACHSHGFDFMIRNGVLIFDTKEEIERRMK